VQRFKSSSFAGADRKPRREYPPEVEKVRDRCYDFLNIYAEKFGENIDFFAWITGRFFSKL
jgi:hypothetical protein